MTDEDRRAYHRERSRAWYVSNREKVLADTAAWRKANPDKVRGYRQKWLKANPLNTRDRQLRRCFDITLEQYNAMLSAQNGACAICYSDKAGGVGAFHVDHDHVTGKVRGLLCQACNTGLGKFKDDAALLDEAAFYLRNRKAR